MYVPSQVILCACLALRTSFCRVTRGDCAYQYFVGTRGGTYTSEDTAIEVMEAGKSVGAQQIVILVIDHEYSVMTTNFKDSFLVICM